MNGDLEKMQTNKSTVTAIDKGVYIIRSEEESKTSTDNLSTSFDFKKNKQEEDKTKENSKLWYNDVAPSIVHYILLVLLGLLTWGLLWVSWGDGWEWNGPWFRLVIVAGSAWASGQVLHGLTGFPPLLAALLTGILARNVGYLDMRQFTSIDMFLRKIYPVIVLGKGSLGWDVNFMKANWRNIVPLGVIPWTLEVVTLATCMHLFFGHPWIWGLLFGTFYASVSLPVVMPIVVKVGSSPDRTRIWPQFVGTAGGIDTALSVGMFGVIHSFMFTDVSETYRYIKAVLTLFVGVGLGVVWGYLGGVVPHKSDFYVTELRILFVVIGGLFANFLVVRFGWLGAAGVGVLACNAVAARCWAQDGWKLNNNPASTAYRVMWSACEPTLFAYTGTFFEINGSLSDTFVFGFAILAICLAVRLGAATLLCCGMTLKERVFICCCWSPKTIVEAVLCPLPINTLMVRGGTELEIKYAEDILRLTIQAILVTTPIVFLLTKHLGPILLKDKDKKCEDDTGS